MGHDHDLLGRHALVTGASAGIGRAAAMALAAQAASVTVVARSEAKLQELALRLKAAGAPQVHILVADLENRAELKVQVEEFLAVHGPVHILVNNAGGPPSGPLLQATEADFAQAFGRLLMAPHLLVQLLLPGMVAEGYGRIVNVISTSVREPLPNLGVSNTIRGATAAWAKTLAKELPPHVTINNVLPGATATDRLEAIEQALAAKTGKSVAEVKADMVRTIPEGRVADPRETAAMIAFLAGPHAAYVRGQSIAVDGGRMNAI
ncbi:MAG TPA: SDR family NAD(P)-dependent oxidoreductase [Holophagaceae bacterium]|nr:SDR family NAD(P)-dependent oxidoreductase [Holophagaceae bacterium]